MHQFTCAKEVLPYLNDLYGCRNITQFDRYARVLMEFKHIYRRSYAHLCSASGRVELIGNHTDHNGGQAIGCTVNLDVITAFAPNGTDTISIVGSGRHRIRFDVNNLDKILGSIGLAKGVVAYFKQQGYNVGGFDAYTNSAIPGGAGISSSAAFSTTIAIILNYCFNDGQITLDEIAKAGQYAENVYFDKPCGLFDQTVIAVGGAVAIDFANGVSCKQIDTDAQGIKLVLIDTGNSHSCLSSLYATIPGEMRTVAKYFGVDRLIQLDENVFLSHFDEVKLLVGERPAFRAKHFFEENRRVAQAEVALSGGDAESLIQLVNQSGDSSLYQLQNCSIDANDTAIADIIATARAICPCGARVHGGGFAGTVLCVVPEQFANDFVSEVTSIYGADRIYQPGIRSVGAVVL